jgi:hypothetical protein
MIKNKLIEEIYPEVKKYYPDAEIIGLGHPTAYIIFSIIEGCCREIHIHENQSAVRGVKRKIKYSYILIESSVNRGVSIFPLISEKKEEIVEVIKAMSKCNIFYRRIRDKEPLITKIDYYLTEAKNDKK